MTDFGPVLGELIATHGPLTLFVLAILETCFVTGLVVPSGTVAAFAAAISTGDPGTLGWILGSIVVGGWVGDTLGYGVGRWWGPHLMERPGWIGGVLRKHQATGGRFLEGHPVYSVTLARLVSFVRTLMPMSAGMSGVRPWTYFAFELPGLLGWAVLYVGIGVLAGESWQLVSSLVGAGWLILFVAIGAVVWWRARRRPGVATRVEGAS